VYTHIDLKHETTDLNIGEKVPNKEFECPWCGNRFDEGSELEAHAKNHYLKKVAVLAVA